jgi:hypothetical protein
MSGTTLQERYWNYVTSDGPKFSRLRSPRPTKALIATYVVMMAAAVVFQLAVFRWPHAVWFFLGCLVVAMAAWTVLRSTIDVRDAAPRDRLDDYEAEVLALWRQRALNVLLVLLFLGALATFTTPVTGTAAGLFMLYSGSVVSTLPAVGYAMTFNRNADEEY